MHDVSTDITRMLQGAAAGDGMALHELFAAVYAELKALAHRQLARHGAATLDTTVLVHETYLKLSGSDALRTRDRGHFYATAARAMRQVVIDHARRRTAEKRGGGMIQATLDDDAAAAALDPEQLIHLDDALGRLGALDARLAELVELRFFAGLSVEQVAELRDVAPRTVLRDWRRARAFLFDSVHGAPAA